MEHGVSVNQSMENIKMLSAELGNVATIHERQCSELNQKNDVLEKNTVKYQRDKEKLCKSTEENCLLDEKLTSTRVNNFKVKEQNENYEMEIAYSLKRTKQIKNKLVDATFTHERDKSISSKENYKMFKYAEKLDEDDVQDVLFLSVSSHAQLLENLSRQKESFLAEMDLSITAGAETKEYLKEMTNEIELLRSTNDFLRSECARKESQVKAVNDEQTSIRQDIRMLEKRNAARLLRLKSQLREVQVNMKRC